MLLLLALAAHAHDGAKIEQELLACLENPEHQSTVGMVGCTTTATRAWDAELNRIYGTLLGKLGTDGQKKLRAAQRAWVAFRDLDLQQITAQADQLEGTMYRLGAAHHALQLTRDRTIALSDRLEEFEVP